MPAGIDARRRLPGCALAAALCAAGSVVMTPPAQAASTDAVVRAVLDEIDAHGWNPATGGLYINWSVDDPSVVDQPGGDTSRHDRLTDLRDLVNMLWYEHRHPGDGSQAAAIARMEPAVQAEFANYSADKGWVYWQLLQLTQLGGGGAFTTEAETFATHMAANIDPAEGVDHGPLNASTAEAAANCPDGYRVDHDLESGLALVDAGARFHNPAWSAVGAREVDVVTGQTFDPAHRLFARIFCQGAVWDQNAKMGEEADEIVALLAAGTSTRTAAYIARAEQMLDVLAGPAFGLHDMARGGYYAKLDMGTGAVDTAYKETRQLTMLTAFHQADLITGGRYAAAEAEMTRVALQMETPVPLAGYPYREVPQFGFFGQERWITTESAGIALEALQAELGGAPAPPAVRAPAPRRPVVVPPVAVAPPAAAPAPAAAAPAPTAAPTPGSAPEAPATPAPATAPATAARAPLPGAAWWALVLLASAIALAIADVSRRLWLRRR